MKERLQIAETISPRSLNHLVRLGLNKRFPDECSIWVKEVNSIKVAHEKEADAQHKQAQDQLNAARAQTESSIRFATVNAVFSGYPCVLLPLLCFADDQVCSALDRSRCFTSVPALTPDEESRLNGEPHRVDNTLY